MKPFPLFAGLLLGAWLALSPVHAEDESGAPPTAPGPLPKINLPAVTLPNASELGLGVPRPVRAVTAALGMGRQRLALVVGNGTIGARSVLDSAPRDSQAVAAALRAGGFIVMARQDLSARDLRASLKEFRERLQPGGVGFIYVSALGAQVDGQNLLLPREAPLDAALPAPELARRLALASVPLTEFVDALLGTSGSPRMLVVDAAYSHPALAQLPARGLAEQRLPPGLMALFGSALNSVQEVPAVAPLGGALPTDPREIAATTFGRVLVDTLLMPRITPPEILRKTRTALFDGSDGQLAPWLAGDTDDKDEFAEATLLDLLPRTKEEVGRELVRQAMSRIARGRGAADAAAGAVGSASAGGAGGVPSGAVALGGEQAVGEVLKADEGRAAREGAEGARRVPRPAEVARNTLAEAPTGGVGSALSTAGSAVGTVAGVASTVAGVAVAAKLAETLVTAQAASTAVSATGSLLGSVGSVASNAVALAARAGASEQPVQGAALSAGRTALAGTAPAATAAAAALPPATGDLPVQALVAQAAAPAAGLAAADAARAAAAPAAAAPAAAPAQPAGPARPPGPVAPRINPFGYVEGDTFIYQVTDTWRGDITGTYVQAIEEVLADGQMLANGAQTRLDPQGRLKMQRGADGSLSLFEPVQELWWSKPERGQRRDISFQETVSRAGAADLKIRWDGVGHVGKLQRVRTPAGEFDALPIESSGWFHGTSARGSQGSGQWSRTVWYSPKLGHPIAIDIEDIDRAGRLLKRERVELLNAQSQRAAP
jgi:hypothetical protein